MSRQPRGQVTGVHLLDDPRVAPSRSTSGYWTQEERDRWVLDGVRPAQRQLFDARDPQPARLEGGAH